MAAIGQVRDLFPIEEEQAGDPNRQKGGDGLLPVLAQ